VEMRVAVRYGSEGDTQDMDMNVSKLRVSPTVLGLMVTDS